MTVSDVTMIPVPVGEDFHFRCHTTNIHADIMLQSKPIIPSTRLTLNPNSGHNISFTLSNVTLADNGTVFTCTAVALSATTLLEVVECKCVCVCVCEIVVARGIYTHI